MKPFEPGELLAGGSIAAPAAAQCQRHGGADWPPDLDSLTPREHDVLDLLARGRSQAEIARDLFISPKTVATHIQHVLSKLDVHSPSPRRCAPPSGTARLPTTPQVVTRLRSRSTESGERSLPFP